MDERKQLILQAIIHDYVESAEPVASRRIAKKHNLGISSATIRNEMCDLEELGFLKQLHTSSGRVPSAKGYRYYVDTILQKERFNQQDMELINAIWKEDPATLTEYFQQMAKVISQVSHNMSLCFAPRHDTSVIRFLHILPIHDTRAVMVVVTDTGALDNEPVFFDESISVDRLNAIAIKFSNALQNVLLKDITLEFLANLVNDFAEDRKVAIKLGHSLFNVLSKRKLFYSVGTPELLGQPEFSTITNVQPILNLLEEEDKLGQILHADSSKPISIRIGTENPIASMHNCSLIQADFSTEDEHIGTLAILGPTRMEYARIIGMLNYMQDVFKNLRNKDK